MEEPGDRFKRILTENNLQATLLKPEIRFLEDGGMIVEAQKIQVNFINMQKEIDEQRAKAETGKATKE